MGLPRDWHQVMAWLSPPTSKNTEPSEKDENSKRFCKKFPEIPTLSSYGLGATKEFWENFPSNPLPSKPETRIDVEALKALIVTYSPSLLKSEQKRALKCIDYLETGGPAFQIRPLGSCHVKNSKAATQHGEEVTDTIAVWITKKFVAGPFDTPPLPNFRANLGHTSNKQDKNLYQGLTSRREKLERQRG